MGCDRSYSDPALAPRISTSPPDSALRPLLGLALHLLRASAHPPLEAYSRLLLTLPLFAPKSGIDHRPLLPGLVACWGPLCGRSSALLLPPSACPAAESSVWLLGNAAFILSESLVPSPSKAPSPGRLPPLDSVLLYEALNHVSDLLEWAPPGVVSDRGSITYEKHGTLITTLVSRTCHDPVM